MSAVAGQVRLVADAPSKGGLLIVDDDSDFAAALCNSLALEGYEVKLADNGDTARSALERFRAQVVLLDLRLEAGSGLDLIAPLKEQYPGLVFIIMTGYAETDVAIEALRRGAYDFLRKPIADGELLAVLERAFERTRLEDAKLAAERALRQSEARYRELFDDSPVAIWTEDWSVIKQQFDDLARGGVKDWRGYFDDHRDQLKTAYDLAAITDISRATVDLYRKESMEELLRMTTAETVIDEELDAFRETVLAFLAGRMSFEIESKDLAGDGSEIIVRRRVVIPPKHGDDWSRVIYVIEDITERKRAEEQLRQAQKMEAVGQLTGGVAHDFNNLLAVIMGNAEMLEERLGREDTALGPILRATRRGAELTQRLLAFSRQQSLRPQVIDLGGLASDMSDMLTRTLGETIEIAIKAGPELWSASADPGQVESALLNLALNARDAMPRGGKLTIECRNAVLDDAYVAKNPEAIAGDYVVLAVSDEGSGMTAEVQARAFEPFFTTKEAGQGSGLGLAMIYGFAKQSGGHVSIYSEAGKGTTVKLYLPRAERAMQNGHLSQDDDPPRGRGEVVLVIEDDPDVRALAARMLESLGYRAKEVADAASAHKVLAEGKPVDLVLSDVVLPGGASGPEFAEQARTTHPDLKVIFMSGYPAEAAKRNGFLGLDQVLLNKPFQKRQLAKAIREALEIGD